MSLGPWLRFYARSPRRALRLTPALLSANRMRGPRRLYIDAEGGPDRGPHVFVRRLVKEMSRASVTVKHDSLTGCSAALMLVSTWGDYFYDVARRLNLRTVLRVDGFFPPVYFDNRDQPPQYQARRLDLDKVSVNQRLQRDLMLADHVVYQSKFSKEMCDRYLYRRRGDYSIVHNGTDTDVFTPVTTEARPVTLISAGNLRHEYMLGTVLPVYEALRDELDVRLLIVGALDEINRRLLDSRLSSDANASQPGITYVGPVKNEELPGWYNQADILVHPRAGDWCPNTVVEALACGLPVVCPRWGGTAELVGDGGISVDAEPWDYSEGFVQKMADGVRSVVSDLSTYKQRARARAVTALRADIMADRYLQCLFPEQAGAVT